MQGYHQQRKEVIQELEARLDDYEKQVAYKSTKQGEAVGLVHLALGIFALENAIRNPETYVQ